MALLILQIYATSVAPSIITIQPANKKEIYDLSMYPLNEDQIKGNDLLAMILSIIWQALRQMNMDDGSLRLRVRPGIPHEGTFARRQVLVSLVTHPFEQVPLVPADVLHAQEGTVSSTLPDPHSHMRPHRALPQQVSLQPLLQSRHHRGPADDDEVGKEGVGEGGRLGGEDGGDGLDEVELVVADHEGLEVDLVAADEVGLEEELVGLLEVVVVLGLRPLRVDLPQFRLHRIQFAVVVGLLPVAVGQPVVLPQLLFGVVVLFGDACDGLHLALFELALAVAEFAADPLVLLDAGVVRAVLVLELREVELGVVLAQITHTGFLELTFCLLLTSCLQGLLLVELQLLVLELLGRQLVVGHVDQRELVLLPTLLRQAQFHLQRMDLLGQLVVGVVLAEDLSHLLVGELVVGLVALLEVEEALQFCLVHLPLHLLPPRQGLLQLLRHPPPHLLLPTHLLLRHLHYRVEVDLHPLDKCQVLLDRTVRLLDTVAVDLRVRPWFELRLEVSQLFAVVDGHGGEAFVDVAKEGIAEPVLQLQVLEMEGTSEEFKGVIPAEIEPADGVKVHPTAHHCHYVYGRSSHAHHQRSLTLVSPDIAVDLVEVGEEGVDPHHHAVHLVALEELLQKGIAAVDGVGERLRDDEGTAETAVGTHQLAQQVVVALLQQREVQDQVALVGTLVVVTRQLDLVVTRVHEPLDRQVRLARVPVLGDLGTEDQLRTVRTRVVPRLDVLRTVVDDEGVLAVTQRLHFLPPTASQLLQRRRERLQFVGHILGGLYVHL